MKELGITPIGVFGKGDTLCDRCSAACCQKGIMYPLTSEEHDFMTKGQEGVFEQSWDDATATSVDGLRRWFTLKVDCPNLDLKTLGCTEHDNPDRPKICQKVGAGDEDCLKIREERCAPSTADIAFNKRRLEALRAARKHAA